MLIPRPRLGMNSFVKTLYLYTFVTTVVYENKDIYTLLLD